MKKILKIEFRNYSNTVFWLIRKHHQDIYDNFVSLKYIFDKIDPSDLFGYSNVFSDETIDLLYLWGNTEKKLMYVRRNLHLQNFKSKSDEFWQLLLSWLFATFYSKTNPSSSAEYHQMPELSKKFKAQDRLQKQHFIGTKYV